jgi:hypothetical protein
MENLIKILEINNLTPENGFGETIISFQDSKIVNVKVTKNIKPERLSKKEVPDFKKSR